MISIFGHLVSFFFLSFLRDYTWLWVYCSKLSASVSSYESFLSEFDSSYKSLFLVASSILIWFYLALAFLFSSASNSLESIADFFFSISACLTLFSKATSLYYWTLAISYTSLYFYLIYSSSCSTSYLYFFSSMAFCYYIYCFIFKALACSYFLNSISYSWAFTCLIWSSWAFLSSSYFLFSALSYYYKSSVTNLIWWICFAPDFFLFMII